MIPGAIINALTFPGLLLHEFFRYVICRLKGVSTSISFFDFLYGGHPEIVSVNDQDFEENFHLLMYWPIFLCSISCLFFAYLNRFTPKESVIEFVVVWLSISCGVHGFPFKHSKGSWALGFIWLDFLYAFILFMIAS